MYQLDDRVIGQDGGMGRRFDDSLETRSWDNTKIPQTTQLAEWLQNCNTFFFWQKLETLQFKSKISSKPNLLSSPTV